MLNHSCPESPVRASAKRTRGLFITGTDTDVGKTYITAMIARKLVESGLSVGVHKPACSGSQLSESQTAHWPDLDCLSAAVGHRFPLDRICPQRFHAPLAPPIAAREEGRHVSWENLRSGADWWVGSVDILLIEGVGGLLCPLTEEKSVADLAVVLGFPLLIVAHLGLGTINHTLLTIEAARARGLSIAGIVLNQTQAGNVDPSTKSNAQEIARRSCVPVVGIVGYAENNGLRRGNDVITMDWSTLAQPQKAGDRDDPPGDRNDP